MTGADNPERCPVSAAGCRHSGDHAKRDDGGLVGRNRIRASARGRVLWTARIWSRTLAIAIVAMRKQRAVPSCVCVGAFTPMSHVANFHALQSRSSRQGSQSASDRFAEKIRQPALKSTRACSKSAAEPVRISLGSKPGAANPTPMVNVGRRTVLLRDRADANVAVVDMLALHRTAYAGTGPNSQSAGA